MKYSGSSPHFTPSDHLDDVGNSSHSPASWWQEDSACRANYFDPTSMLADLGDSPAGIDNTIAADGAQLIGIQSRGSSSDSSSGDGTCRGGTSPDEAGGSQQGSSRRGRKPLTADQVKVRSAHRSPYPHYIVTVRSDSVTETPRAKQAVPEKLPAEERRQDRPARARAEGNSPAERAPGAAYIYPPSSDSRWRRPNSNPGFLDEPAR